VGQSETKIWAIFVILKKFELNSNLPIGENSPSLDSGHPGCSQGRVIRLGDFSPIGQLFSLGGSLKITGVDKIFGLFSYGDNCAFILTK
jgi:hypothetical protein